MEENKAYKYFAFISYNSKDQKWGKRLQRKLESYRLPSTLCSEHSLSKRPIKPVFFAPTDIQPGGLNEELQERLRESEYLIVICSPNSAKSEWVGREIEYFSSLGRKDNIQFFIVDGIPHSGNPETECFNPVTEKLGLPEILGANIHEKIYKFPWLNKERAYIQLISKLLNVEFDSIWNRHRRQMINRLIAWIVGVILVAGAIVWVALAHRPVDVDINIHNNQDNINLPELKDATVQLYLENEMKSDILRDSREKLVFSNIPKNMLGKEARIVVNAKDFLPVDTVVTLSRTVNLQIMRDPVVYGNVTFRLWDPNREEGVSGKEVMVGGVLGTTDSKGFVSLQVPIENQRIAYKVETDLKLLNDTIIMPCSESSALIVDNE